VKRPAELDDWDRKAEYAATARAVSNYWARVNEYDTRPMGASKRIPSPYTDAPRPIKREDSDSAMVAFCCFATMGGILTIVGAVQLVRWIVEAVR
jgi:hypothetical protein